MNAPSQTIKAYLCIGLYFILITAFALLAGCSRKSMCPAYSLGANEPLIKATWSADSKPKAAWNRTAHYAYKKRPNALVAFFSGRR